MVRKLYLKEYNDKSDEYKMMSDFGNLVAHKLLDMGYDAYYSIPYEGSREINFSFYDSDGNEKYLGTIYSSRLNFNWTYDQLKRFANKIVKELVSDI